MYKHLDKPFEKWQQTRGININLPDISPIELDSILQKFYAELRAEKGEEYEPASLRIMLCALHRYVKGKVIALVLSRQWYLLAQEKFSMEGQFH